MTPKLEEGITLVFITLFGNGVLGNDGHWDPFLIGLIFSYAHCADVFGPRPKIFD